MIGLIGCASCRRIFWHSSIARDAGRRRRGSPKEEEASRSDDGRPSPYLTQPKRWGALRHHLVHRWHGTESLRRKRKGACGRTRPALRPGREARPDGRARRDLLRNLRREAEGGVGRCGSLSLSTNPMGGAAARDELALALSREPTPRDTSATLRFSGFPMTVSSISHWSAGSPDGRGARNDEQGARASRGPTCWPHTATRPS